MGSNRDLAVMQAFAMGILADAEARASSEHLPSDSRLALAAALRSHADVNHARSSGVLALSGIRSPFLQSPSDTTLKLRHEVAETLREADRDYDLDIQFGPGLNAELALLPGRSRSRSSSPAGEGAGVWMLDGPEAFFRPFVRSKLRLVPSELRRAELIAAVRQDAL